MKPEEWFRRTAWDSEIEAAFEARLRRSRTPCMRAQYLRIQGITLIVTRRTDLTRIGIRLTHRVLAEYADERGQISPCLCALGNAHEQLGDFEEAISFYRKAWTFERDYPNTTTQARLNLAMLIIRLGRKADADEALEAIQPQYHGGTELLVRDVMLKSLVRASVAAWRGDAIAAAEHAKMGLEAAARTRSPLRYHPTLGLVTSEDAAEVEALKRLAGE
jgi:tetratricopeptide (TPR) repeat protein